MGGVCKTYGSDPTPADTCDDSANRAIKCDISTQFWTRKTDCSSGQTCSNGTCIPTAPAAAAPATCSSNSAYSCTNSSNCQSGTVIAASDCGQQGEDPTRGTVCCIPAAAAAPDAAGTAGTTTDGGTGNSGTVGETSTTCTVGSANGTCKTSCDPAETAYSIATNSTAYCTSGVCCVINSGTTGSSGNFTGCTSAQVPSEDGKTCVNKYTCGDGNGSCQAGKDSTYCDGNVHGHYYPAGDAYCKASTNGGHPYCCYTPGTPKLPPSSAGNTSAPAPTGPKPTVPTLACTTATSTTATLSWTKDVTNTSGTLLYYCDKDLAAAHNVSCRKDAQATTDGSRAGWYLLAGNAATNSPQTISGLIAGHTYTAFVRAYNGAQSNFTDSTPDVTFTAGSCGNGTKLIIDLGLDAIGHVGDRPNPTKWQQVANQAGTGSNQTLKTNPRKLDVKVGTIDKPDTPFSLNATSGIFEGTVDLGTSITTGSYLVTLTTPGYLVRKVANVTITANKNDNKINFTDATTGPYLVPGDIVGNNDQATPDNNLGPLDYSMLMSCLIDDHDINTSSASQSTCNTNNTLYHKLSDLNDDGKVDKFDYNLFIREISKIQNGD